MNEIAEAVQRSYDVFLGWNVTAQVFTPGTPEYDQIHKILEHAVLCGVQAERTATKNNDGLALFCPPGSC